MDPSLLTVASGMKAQIETLEVLGNNIANHYCPVKSRIESAG